MTREAAAKAHGVRLVVTCGLAANAAAPSPSSPKKPDGSVSDVSNPKTASGSTMSGSGAWLPWPSAASLSTNATAKCPSLITCTSAVSAVPWLMWKKGSRMLRRSPTL
jgi:hypothetical protein